MVSLRNLPLVAEFGYQSVFLFLVVAICFFLPVALVAAELATGWTQSGGIYIWVREAFGERWGFFAVWVQWAHNITWYSAILFFVASTLAYIFSPSLAMNKAFVEIVTLVLFWTITFLNYRGLKISSLLSTIGALGGTILPGLLIILLGILWIARGDLIQLPFTVKNFLPDFSSFDQLVFIGGLFLAFSGSEVSASYASEVKSPQKNYPRAILIAAAVTLFFSIFGSLSILVVVPQGKISLVEGVLQTLYTYLSQFKIGWTLPIIAFLLIGGALAEVNSWVIGLVKALHRSAINGNLPPIFHNLNRRGIPTHLLILQGVIVTITSLVILFMPSISTAYWILSAISAQVYLVMYAIMFLAAIRLRYTHPHIKRHYRIPYSNKGIWLIASLGLLSAIFAIFVAFIPPSQIPTGNIYIYESLLIGGFIISLIIPLVISRFRKPSWKTNHDVSTKHE